MSYRSAYALALLWGISATPVVAVTPVTPVGVESCDAFLEAYAQCAASPGVPEAARPGIRQGINTMRESFRDSVLRNEAARPTVAYQCAQAHEAVRKSLIDAFKCDFPAAPAASQALLQSPLPPPGAARVAARPASAQTPEV